MKTIKTSIARCWLPNEELILAKWHSIIIKAIHENGDKKEHKVIKKFRQLLQDDPIARM